MQRAQNTLALIRFLFSVSPPLSVLFSVAKRPVLTILFMMSVGVQVYLSQWSPAGCATDSHFMRFQPKMSLLSNDSLQL